MPITTRRAFVAWLAALPPASLVARGRRTLPGAPLDLAPLRALAEAVLPSELGREGVAREVAAFQRWLADFKPGAELNHGYGTPTIRQAPADPGPRWAAQLAALDEAARRRHGKALAALDRPARQALVREALAADRAPGLPDVASARHVALAVLAHWYGSPEAVDLCYEAEIRRTACRPLAAAAGKPVPLRRARS